MAVLMAHTMEVTFNLQFAHLAQIIGGFVCMVEIKSVFENITKITNEPVFMKIYKLFEKKAQEAIDTSTSLSVRETKSSSTSLNDGETAKDYNNKNL